MFLLSYDMPTWYLQYVNVRSFVQVTHGFAKLAPFRMTTIQVRVAPSPFFTRIKKSALSCIQHLFSTESSILKYHFNTNTCLFPPMELSLVGYSVLAQRTLVLSVINLQPIWECKFSVKMSTIFQPNYRFRRIFGCEILT